VSYLTQNLNWKADYVVVVDKTDKAMRIFQGGFTLDNNSGATYKDARLKLVAGEVHRARKQGMTWCPGKRLRERFLWRRPLNWRKSRFLRPHIRSSEEDHVEGQADQTGPVFWNLRCGVIRNSWCIGGIKSYFTRHIENRPEASL